MAAAALLLSGLLAAAQPRSIHDIDFKNAVYAWDDPFADRRDGFRWFAGLPVGSVELKDGRHTFVEPGIDDPHPAFLEGHVAAYGDLDGDGRDEAAVDLIYHTGGTGNWHYLYVYSLQGRHTRLLGMLQSGERAYGGLVGVAIQDRLLVLDFADQDRKEGDCCSRGFIREHYRYKSGKFTKTGRDEKDSVRFTIYDEIRSRPSPDKKWTVIRQELNPAGREIWLARADGSDRRRLYSGPFLWKGVSYPSSAIGSVQWALDGLSIYFATNFTAREGAIWRLEIASGRLTPMIPDGVSFGVIQTGMYAGYLIATQRALANTDTDGSLYPAYPYFLFTADGKRAQQIARDDYDLDVLVKEFENQ